MRRVSVRIDVLLMGAVLGAVAFLVGRTGTSPPPLVAGDAVSVSEGPTATVPPQPPSSRVRQPGAGDEETTASSAPGAPDAAAALTQPGDATEDVALPAPAPDDAAVEAAAVALDAAGAAGEALDARALTLLRSVFPRRATATAEGATATSAPSTADPTDAEHYRKLGASVATFFDTLVNDTDAVSTHRNFARLRRFLLLRLTATRRRVAADTTRSPCHQFVRMEERPGDDIYRVPCVPRRFAAQPLRGLVTHEYGVWASFWHIAPPTGAERPPLPPGRDVGDNGKDKDGGGGKGKDPAAAAHRLLSKTFLLESFRPSLRVAVEMSGHMRTFRRTRRSLVERLLVPNRALLFVATYPDIGDKRFGVRVQERDDPVDPEELAASYAPHLAGMYLADAPTVRARLQRVFPQLFGLSQWSWMIYQLFMMEIVHNVTVAHVGAPGAWRFEQWRHENVFFPTDPKPTGPEAASWDGGDAWRTAGGFDVIMRVRPDLYILGSIFLVPSNATASPSPAQPSAKKRKSEGSHDRPPSWMMKAGSRSAVFAMLCRGNVYTDEFSETQLLRAPHHPKLEWFVDPLSDHSAVGYAPAMSHFLRLYDEAQALLPKEQEKVIFFHGNTAERIWSQYTERSHMRVISTFGWHIMVRNAEKWNNSTNTVAKTARRRNLMNKIFSVTDPEEVVCPPENRVMWTMPPKTKVPRGRMKGKK